jgi:hypothetical protein
MGYLGDLSGTVVYQQVNQTGVAFNQGAHDRGKYENSRGDGRLPDVHLLMVLDICIGIHGILSRPRISITPDTKGISDHLGIPNFQHVKC